MSITDTVINFVPATWLTYGLRLYVSVYENIDYFYTQGIKFYNSVFEPKTTILYFFSNSILPQLSSKEILSSKDSYWSFNLDTNVFMYKNSTNELKHLPYICADLKSDSNVQTISEWIEKVHIQTPNDVSLPIHILIISWAYSMNKILEPLDKYTLNVITTDGEEKYLNIVETEKA